MNEWIYIFIYHLLITVKEAVHEFSIFHISRKSVTGKDEVNNKRLMFRLFLVFLTHIIINGKFLLSLWYIILHPTYFWRYEKIEAKVGKINGKYFSYFKVRGHHRLHSFVVLWGSLLLLFTERLMEKNCSSGSTAALWITAKYHQTVPSRLPSTMYFLLSFFPLSFLAATWPTLFSVQFPSKEHCATRNTGKCFVRVSEWIITATKVLFIKCKVVLGAGSSNDAVGYCGKKWRKMDCFVWRWL